LLLLFFTLQSQLSGINGHAHARFPFELKSELDNRFMCDVFARLVTTCLNNFLNPEHRALELSAPLAAVRQMLLRQMPLDAAR